jgi:PQQ-like domain
MAKAAATRFPRGVADIDAGRAFVHDRAGAVLALDLATGDVLWRTGKALRPVSAVDSVVVAVRVASRSAIEVVVLDARNGREVRVSEPLALPDWANASLDDTADFALRAETEGHTVLLSWTAQARYRGGAPPSPRVQAQFEHEASGAARVDVHSGAVEPVPFDVVAPELADESAARASEPDVLVQVDIGTTRYQLVVPGGAKGVLIRAVDRSTDRMIWETVIEEASPRRPGPLRQ